MKNRFFDVDNSIYLNSLYIVTLMINKDEGSSIERLMLELYLMKNPKVFIEVSKKYKIEHCKNLYFDFEYENLQSEMLKYSLRLHTEGFYEALSYLYSKDLINYDSEQNRLNKARLFNDIDLQAIPTNITSLARTIDGIFNKYNIDDLRSSIELIERSYYGQ